FKNESANLKTLLKSLSSLNYPKDRYEVIFVDDGSTDNSVEIIKNFTEKNFHLISAMNKKLPGKKGALEIGISYASFDTIVLTDADCAPEDDWLLSISKKMSEGFDLIFGYSPLYYDDKFISKFSSYENLRNYVLYFASSGLCVPYSATSRSMAFTKKAYQKLKGYQNTTETLSGDDDLFIREAVKHKLKISSFRFGNDLVISKPSASFKDYFKQKSRHLKTSHHYLIRHQILLALWHLTNIASLLCIFLIPSSFIFSLPVGTKILTDIFTINVAKKKLPHNFSWYDVLYLQPVYELFLIINFINSFLRKDKWK
ncbi:MAG: glycosyltransferase, partial [Ignavibacterium sp.]